MYSRRLITAVLIGADQAQAYTNTLDACESFAALWNGGCGGTTEDNVYMTADWNTAGPGVVTSNCATGDSDVFALEPIVGTQVNTYSIFSRNCITCREADGDVLIRY